MIFNVGGAAFKPPVLNASYPADVSIVQSSSASATFQVVISEAGEPAEYAYQWYVNNSPVSGATSASYTKSNLSSVGTYIIYCTVTHPAGVVTSRSATLSVLSAIPNFTYSGSYEIIDDGNGDWRVKLKTSGKLRFSSLGKGNGNIDVFLVGAGGGGGGDYGAGGGGGYTKTAAGIAVKTATDYTITIGAGVNGGDGGTTSAFNQTAEGGKKGDPTNGGIGGSGGGGGASSTTGQRGGNGGSNGGNGGAGYGSGGKGQGTSTREFYPIDNNTGATLYAGGGGGYQGNGGAGGGGGSATNGTNNTGGGGGGVKSGASSKAGGSGIVVIRNKR